MNKVERTFPQIKTERINCPLCGEINREFPSIEITNCLWKLTDGFLELPDLQYKFCPDHDLVWMSRRPTEPSFNTLYSHSPRLLRTDPEPNRPVDQERIQFVEQHVECPVNRWTDVGTNDGSLLLTAKNQGMEVLGLEPSSAAVERLNIFDDSIAVHNKRLQEGIEEGKAFAPDVISLIHVFEHLPHPLDALNSLKKMYPEYILLEVPDAGAGLFPRIFREHGHLFYYTNNSIRRLLFKSGWNVVETDKTSSRGLRILARFDSEVPRYTSGQNEVDIEQFNDLNDRYSHLMDQEQSALDKWLKPMSSGASIGLYGAGSDGLRWLHRLQAVGREVNGFIDRNADLLSFSAPGSYDVSKPNEQSLSRLDALLITPLGQQASIATSIHNEFSSSPPLYWVEPDGTIASRESSHE